jgi:hypothetical protein
MNKRRGAVTGLVCVAWLLPILSQSSYAADNQTVWEGFLTVTSSTAQCAPIGGTSPTVFTRAAVTSCNLDETTVPQMAGTGNYKATAINSKAKPFTYNGTYNFTISPIPVVLSTPTVLISSGTLNNFFDTAGCTISFKGTYVKRID